MSRLAEDGSKDHSSPSPQDRQRVRRACEACRKRKIKCDGDDPCKRCSTQNLVCQYSEWTTSNDANSAAMKNMEIRMVEMEKTFGQFKDDIISSIASLQTSRIPPNDASLAANMPSQNGTSPTRRLQERSALSDSSTNEIDDRSVKAWSWEREHVDDARPQLTATKSDCDHAFHADGAGELDPDLCGHLRYVGLGSTATIVDRCIGLRQHISQGLQLKGHQQGEAFLTTPNADLADRIPLWLHHRVLRSLPSTKATGKLIHVYFARLSSLFPIVTEKEIHQIYRQLLSKQRVDIGHIAILLSVLASAVLLTKQDDGKGSETSASALDAGSSGLFYDLATEIITSTPDIAGPADLQSIVVTKALLALYHVGIGSQAEAWILVGDAIRRGQDIGLHRSPEKLKLPLQQQAKRLRIWWCLYILEVQLSTALGRPLAIHDEDCSVELPRDDSNNTSMSDFISAIRLHQILKDILRTINSIKNVTNWQDDTNRRDLKTKIHRHHASLVDWASRNASDRLQATIPGSNAGTKLVTTSFFHISVVLLYRLFMPHPHRPSTSETESAQKICAQNAVQCICAFDDSLEQIPPHYLIFSVQNIFVSAIVLLQCIRSSNDSGFTANSFKVVEKATKLLRSADYSGAKKYLATIEEYIDLTRLMQQGVYRKGICNFDGHNLPTTSQRREKHSLFENSLNCSNNPPTQNFCKRRRLRQEQSSTAGGVHRAQTMMGEKPITSAEGSWNSQRSSVELLGNSPNPSSATSANSISGMQSVMLSPSFDFSFGVNGEDSLPLFPDLPPLDGSLDSNLYWINANCGTGSIADELDSSVFDSWEGNVF